MNQNGHRYFAAGLALSILAPIVSAQAMEVAGPARVVDGDTLEIGAQ